MYLLPYLAKEKVKYPASKEKTGLCCMSFDYLIDSYAWVEYYTGSKKGIKIKEIIETKNIATPILAIAELSDKFARENNDFNELFQFINSRSTIIPLNVKIAI